MEIYLCNDSSGCFQEAEQRCLAKNSSVTCRFRRIPDRTQLRCWHGGWPRGPESTAPRWQPRRNRNTVESLAEVPVLRVPTRLQK